MLASFGNNIINWTMDESNNSPNNREKVERRQLQHIGLPEWIGPAMILRLGTCDIAYAVMQTLHVGQPFNNICLDIYK